MRIKSTFLSPDGSWRTGWRIIAMFVLLAAVIIGFNVAWKSLGLPGRQESGPWGFLLFASLISGAALGVIALLLRYFENRGLDAIGMPFVANAWKQTAVGTLMGAVPVSLLVGLALLAGYGTISPSSFALAGLAAALLPMLIAGFFLAAWEEFVLRG